MASVLGAITGVAGTATTAAAPAAATAGTTAAGIAAGAAPAAGLGAGAAGAGTLGATTLGTVGGGLSVGGPLGVGGATTATSLAPAAAGGTTAGTVGGLGQGAAGTLASEAGLMGSLKSMGSQVLQRYGLNKTPKTKSDWGNFSEGMSKLTEDFSTMQEVTGEKEQAPVTYAPKLPQRGQPIGMVEPMPGLRGLLKDKQNTGRGMF